MGKIILHVSGWILRKFGLLLLLIITLLLAPSVFEAWQIVVEFDPVTTTQTIKRETEALVPSKDTAKEEIEQRFKKLQSRLEEKKKDLTELDRESCYLPMCSMVNTSKRYKLDIEVALLEQALTYVSVISTGRKACEERTRHLDILNELRLSVLELENSRPVWVLRRAEAHRNLIKKLAEAEQQQVMLDKGCQTYRQLSNSFEANQNQAQQKLGTEYTQFLNDVDGLKASRFKILALAKEVLPSALVALAAIIFVPIGIKLFSYYGVAVLASRKFGVRLLPGSSGELVVASPPQALQRIALEKDWELLINPALLRSSPDSAEKHTRILLDWAMPFSSIAAGLYLLTCIRTDDNGEVTISAGEDEFSEITVLEIPDKSALVLQPRCLAGIVQLIDRPLKITRPWRIGNLGSWLTMQFRYVVFHGPAKLIVKGNRGVEVDSVLVGSSINQNATLGFTANLSYGVKRSGTFYGYLSGKNELFNDCFSFGQGYYVHEVRPRPFKKTLLPGRGIEGILNSILKVFGI